MELPDVEPRINTDSYGCELDSERSSRSVPAMVGDAYAEAAVWRIRPDFSVELTIPDDECHFALSQGAQISVLVAALRADAVNGHDDVALFEPRCSHSIVFPVEHHAVTGHSRKVPDANFLPALREELSEACLDFTVVT